MEQCEQPVEVEFEQALGFVQAVKQALSPSAYTAFLDVLRAYREDSLTSVDVKTKCDALFGGHSHLLAGLVAFLPHGSSDGVQDAALAPTPVYRSAVLPHGLCSASAGEVEGGVSASALVQGASRRSLRTGAH